MKKSIWIAAVVTLAAPSPGLAERALPLSTSSFARELRAEMKKRGETLPDRDDCFASAVPCKITGLPETLEVWMYPDKEGALTSARVNFHDAFGNPDAVLGAARDICTAMIAVTANGRFDRKLLDRGFTSAGRLGHCLRGARSCVRSMAAQRCFLRRRRCGHGAARPRSSSADPGCRL